MSNEATQEDKSRPHSDSSPQALQEHRDDLELIADSDLPAAWVADELLTIIDGNAGTDE